MQSFHNVIHPALIALALTTSSLSLALAQPATHPATVASAHAANTPAAAATAPLKGPSFQSGGLKATVVSVAASGNSVSMSLIIENTGKDDVLIAVMGEANGGNNGASFVSDTISGITGCPALDNFHETVKACLTAADPKLPVSEFTLLGKGNTIPVSISFHKSGGEGNLDKAQPFNFAMTVAYIKDEQISSEASDPLQAHKSSSETTTPLPKGLRFIAIGIPTVSLSPQ